MSSFFSCLFSFFSCLLSFLSFLSSFLLGKLLSFLSFLRSFLFGNLLGLFFLFFLDFGLLSSLLGFLSYLFGFLFFSNFLFLNFNKSDVLFLILSDGSRNVLANSVLLILGILLSLLTFSRLFLSILNLNSNSFLRSFSLRLLLSLFLSLVLPHLCFKCLFGSLISRCLLSSNSLDFSLLPGCFLLCSLSFKPFLLCFLSHHLVPFGEHLFFLFLLLSGEFGSLLCLNSGFLNCCETFVLFFFCLGLFLGDTFYHGLH